MSNDTITLTVSQLKSIIQSALKTAEKEIMSKVMATNASASSKSESSEEVSEKESKASKKPQKTHPKAKKAKKGSVEVPDPQSHTELGKLNKPQLMKYCEYHGIEVESSREGKVPLLPAFRLAAQKHWETLHPKPAKGSKKPKTQKTQKSKSESSDEPVTKEAIKKMMVGELRKLAKERGIKLEKGERKASIKDKLLKSLEDVEVTSVSSTSDEASSSSHDESSGSSSKAPLSLEAEFNKDLRLFTVRVGKEEYFYDTETKSLVAPVQYDEAGEPKVIKMKVAQARALDKEGYPLWHTLDNRHPLNKTATAKEIKEIIEVARENDAGDEASSSSGADEAASNTESEASKEEAEADSSSEEASSEDSSASSSSAESSEEGEIDSELAERVKVTEEDFEKFYRAVRVGGVDLNNTEELKEVTGLDEEVIEDIKMRYKRYTSEDFAAVVTRVNLDARKKARNKANQTRKRGRERLGERRPRFGGRRK